MAVNLVFRGFQTMRTNKQKGSLLCSDLGTHYPKSICLITRLPNSGALRLLGRVVALALLVVSFPWLGSILRGSLSFSPGDNGVSDSINFELLSLFVRDLTNEGLLKLGEKSVFVSSEDAIYKSLILSDNLVEFISVTDSDRLDSVPNGALDFVLTQDFRASAEFIDRALKIGGIVAVELRDFDFSPAFHRPTNYKTVYLRRFGYGSTVVAIRKSSQDETKSAAQRRLLGYATEAKKAALNNLEDVLLEPPRAASGKSRQYLKRTRYLPDLMGDTLESYPRHVFIDVGVAEKEGGSGTGWFEKNYPKRNKNFEVYKIETVNEETLTTKKKEGEEEEIGMSEWLRRNVREEEYVVMKAEAEVVEEMIKSKVIALVDELFLECKPQGKGSRNRRAYWECLALYGRLRDEGVAVHQWWG